MMVFINAVYKEDVYPLTYAKSFIKLLSPITPHICEEIWHEVFNEKDTIAYASWPSYDDTKLLSDIATMEVSVNGKVRATITISKDLPVEEVK